MLYACAECGTTLPWLVSVGSPIRHDMAVVAERARPRIRRWLHLHSDWSDTMQVLGELADVAFAVQRAAIYRRDVGIPGIGHSSVLHDRRALWIEHGCLDWIRNA